VAHHHPARVAREPLAGQVAAVAPLSRRRAGPVAGGQEAAQAAPQGHARPAPGGEIEQLLGDVAAAGRDRLGRHVAVALPLAVGRMRVRGRGRGVAQAGGGHDAGGHAGARRQPQPRQQPARLAAGAVVHPSGGHADRPHVGLHPGGDRGHGAGRVGGLVVGVVGLAERGVGEVLPGQQVLLALEAATLPVEDPRGGDRGRAHAVAEEHDHVARGARARAKPVRVQRTVAIPPRRTLGFGCRNRAAGDRRRRCRRRRRGDRAGGAGRERGGQERDAGRAQAKVHRALLGTGRPAAAARAPPSSVAASPQRLPDIKDNKNCRLNVVFRAPWRARAHLTSFSHVPHGARGPAIPNPPEHLMVKPLSLAVAAALALGTYQSAHAAAATAENDEATNDASTQAAEDATTLDHVIVTGSRLPRAADRIPGAVSVITKQEITNSLTLTEDATAVLSRMLPGYSESTQALTNSGETLRGRIALRLFDGVPQTSPLRETNRAGSFTDLGIVDRIEVINGPSAAEGIGAAGGIINYISKRPVRGTEATLTTRWTTQGYDDSDGWKVGMTFGHGEDDYDVLVSASFVDRGTAFEGNGRAIGMRGSGTINDSEANNLFLKFGLNFGEDYLQRLQATVARLHLVGKGNYTGVDGDRANNITNTVVRGTPLGARPEFNDFDQIHLQYRHDDLFGGSLLLDAYRADQSMRYPAENGSDRQDPEI